MNSFAEAGVMLVHTDEKALAHVIQHGLQDHHGAIANVVLRDGKYQVRVVTTLTKKQLTMAGSYAIGVIDGWTRKGAQQ